ncbi:hypothetical protein HDV05_004529 [Chytridiales sp. JEL 0842]|nr:hypothetical protein HDV05_004529 [Chytridiales sp. JEL 0842]
MAKVTTSSRASLQSILQRISKVYFQEYMPISQFSILKNPDSRIKRIAAISPADRASVISQFKTLESELKSLRPQKLEYLESIILKEALIALDIITQDDEIGWFPYLSENFMTGVHSSWLYAVVEGKIMAGAPSAEQGRQTLLSVLELTPSWMKETIDAWREGVKRGLVMSEGGVNQTVQDIKDRYLDTEEYEKDPGYWKSKEKLLESRYWKLAEFSEEEKDRALNLIGETIQGWDGIISYLNTEYLPVARRIRPYSNPGLNALGKEKGEALYKHLTRRFVTNDIGDPTKVAQLGRDITSQIQKDMTEIGQSYFGCKDFSDVAAMLIDRSNPHAFLQDMTTDKVKEYLFKEAEDIKSKLSPEFTVLPQCDFDIKLFKSAGVAYYVTGRVNLDIPPTDSAFCVERGAYYAGVPTLDPKSTFAYEKDDLSLLMHESTPGHHHQLQVSIESKPIYDLMTDGLQSALTSSQSGFVEGWALYAESLGFRMGLYDLPKYPMRALRHHNNNLLRSLRLILDTELNTGVCNREDAVKLMVENGFTKEYAEFEVDRYTSAPGQALGYMLGCVVLQRLRKRCEEVLGERFKSGEFHDVVLRAGTVTLETVEANVEQYLSSKQ